MMITCLNGRLLYLGWSFLSCVRFQFGVDRVVVSGALGDELISDKVRWEQLGVGGGGL